MKNYNTQKKIVIAALSVICLCLAAGLIYYLGYIDRSQVPPAGITENTDVTAPEVTVLPLAVPSNDASKQDKSTGEQNSGADTTVQDKTPPEQKPKTPEEAVPPAPPTVKDEKALTDPVKPPEYTPEQTKPSTETDTPKSGDKKDGKIYVPGFGWVEDKGGGVEVKTAPNAGTGEVIGDM